MSRTRAKSLVQAEKDADEFLASGGCGIGADEAADGFIRSFGHLRGRAYTNTWRVYSRVFALRVVKREPGPVEE